jgi:hypothetical protein
MELDCTNGPISIYDTGAWIVDKNYTVKPAAGSPVDAAFLISSTGTVEFKQGAKIYVGFYAPTSGIKVHQGAECWGALVGDQITVDQATSSFDVNLKKFKLPWDVPDPTASARRAPTQRSCRGESSSRCARTPATGASFQLLR